MNVLEMKCLRNLVGVSGMDRVRNDEVRIGELVLKWSRRVYKYRADQRVLRWSGRVWRMDVYRLARRVLMADVSGRRVQGRPRLGSMDGVKIALGSRDMTVDAARQCEKDIKEWRAQVHM